MLTGQCLFEGETISDTLIEVATKEPDWDRVPQKVRRLLRRCLEKDPRKRLRDMGDVESLLEEAPPEGTVQPAPSPSSNKSRLGIVASIAAVVTLALAALAFIHFREKPPAPAAPVRFQIPAPGNMTLNSILNLSPDGRKLAFLAGGRLWVHFLESGESRDLTATEGSPFWSPDSRFIGYPFQNKLKKIEATGGPSQTVSDFDGNWGAGAWNQDDAIVFGVIPGGLFRVPASGGVPVQITALNPARHELYHDSPSFLPDGRYFVYWRSSKDQGQSASYIGSIDAKPEQQSSAPLLPTNSQPIYAPSADPDAGYILFVRAGTLMAQPFDNRRLELKGKASVVA